MAPAPGGLQGQPQAGFVTVSWALHGAVEAGEEAGETRVRAEETERKEPKRKPEHQTRQEGDGHDTERQDHRDKRDREPRVRRCHHSVSNAPAGTPNTLERLQAHCQAHVEHLH